MSETHAHTARTRVVREAHRGIYERVARIQREEILKKKPATKGTIPRFNRDVLREALRPLFEEFVSVLWDQLNGSIGTGQLGTWISSEQAAKRIGINPKTLVNWRSRQHVEQPPFYKPPGHGSIVRYKLREVDEWLESYRRIF